MRTRKGDDRAYDVEFVTRYHIDGERKNLVGSTLYSIHIKIVVDRSEQWVAFDLDAQKAVRRWFPRYGLDDCDRLADTEYADGARQRCWTTLRYNWHNVVGRRMSGVT